MSRETISAAEYHGLAKNSLWVVVSNLSLVFVLVLNALASRVLGDTVFGQYTYLLAVSTLLANLSSFGTTDYISVVTAKEPARTGKLVANTLGLRIPLGTAYVAVCMIVTWFTMPEALPASLFISLDWLVRTLIRFVRGVLRARDVFHLDAQVATTERLATLIAASVGLFAGRTLLAFTLGFLIGRIIALSFCLWVYLRLGERLWIGFQYREWRTILRNSLPMGLRGMLRVVSFRVDAVILGLLRPSQEVGWYGAAYQFVEVSFFFQEAIGGSFQPAIARASGRGLQGMVSDLYGRAYKLILTISGLGAAIGFVYAGRLVALAFGDNYVNSTPALRILIWVMLLVPSWMMSVVLLDAVGSQAKTVRPFFVSVAGTILLNLFLIQQVGFLGAAWSTLLTEFFLTITLLRTSFNLGYRFPLTWLVGPVVACGAFTAVASMLHSSLILGAGLGLAAFLATLVVFGVFDEVDRGYGQLLFKKVMNLARRQYVS